MYELKSEKDLDALALKRHPIELDSDGFDKNYLPRQVFINGYLLGMKHIIDQLNDK